MLFQEHQEKFTQHCTHLDSVPEASLFVGDASLEEEIKCLCGHQQPVLHHLIHHQECRAYVSTPPKS